MHPVVMLARRSRSIVMALMACVPLSLNAQRGGSSSREVHLMVPVDSTGLRVFVRHLPPAKGTAIRGRSPVLFVHGASFPSALAAAFRFDGHSWMDDLANQGFDVWALDFLGYGGSDRYREMAAPAEQHPPLGRAPEAARQIAAAVERIVALTGVSRVSLIAHSWGTIPAGLYSGEHPERVDRLVLFGPVTQRAPSEPPAAAAPAPAHWLITEEDQRSRFFGYLPKGERPVLDTRHFSVWGPAYMATDPESDTRTPASVRIPAGPIADFDDAWSGRLPFDPAKVRAPTLIIRGEWENVTTDADARWLFDALTGSPVRRDVKISRGSHVMHLEESRIQLYREVAAFLQADDTPPKPAPDRPTQPGAAPRRSR